MTCLVTLPYLSLRPTAVSIGSSTGDTTSNRPSYVRLYLGIRYRYVTRRGGEEKTTFTYPPRYSNFFFSVYPGKASLPPPLSIDSLPVSTISHLHPTPDFADRPANAVTGVETSVASQRTCLNCVETPHAR